MEKENWNHKDKTIKTQIASDPWCDCLPSKQEINLLNNEKTTENEKKALSEFFDFLNHLSNRTYWAISYSPKNRLVLDGGVCIFIDAYTGEYLGRFGMGLPGYY
ncbi:MAG: hypothetical protein G3M70_13825 [Candidatus Nitronauta litoralis]|uniref:Uncharacterized protein n=1 Tax=Candidatus Nitronauta litoralis TaxID=2705533 RepID=A0A7T0BXT4_9BACT|nr:MAG: hypothetical protein G3M70_13825 [Candidatus Nitronauta litoralis]